MKRLTIGEITKAIDGSLLCGDPDRGVHGISTDSRTVKEREVFFPLIGEKFDAHDFVEQVLQKGCKAVVISRNGNWQQSICRLAANRDTAIIQTADTTKALQQLAAYYLQSCSLKKIAVTGSTGKTTTKEMLYHIFSKKFKTKRNQGNLNNHIGLPLTAFTMEEDTQIGIFEMGMSEYGEIDLLAQIVKPDVGIITNIGTAHIENLGSREGILKAKMEITNYFGSENLLIINDDEQLLTREKVKGSYRLITVGERGRSEFILSGIKDYGEKGITFYLEHQEEMQLFTLQIPGRHNAYNASLAVACATNFGVTMKEAADGLAAMEAITDKRLSIKGKHGVKVIDDTYNASPDSMKAAIDVLMSTSGIRKIAILGDMLEMGADAPKYHHQVGEYVAGAKADLLVCVGEHAKDIASGAAVGLTKEQIIYRQTKEEVYELMEQIIPGDVILVKGSRGMEMDKIVKRIMEKE